jgi:hypothetical protein
VFNEFSLEFAERFYGLNHSIKFVIMIGFIFLKFMLEHPIFGGYFLVFFALPPSEGLLHSVEVVVHQLHFIFALFLYFADGATYLLQSFFVLPAYVLHFLTRLLLLAYFL